MYIDKKLCLIFQSYNNYSTTTDFFMVHITSSSSDSVLWSGQYLGIVFKLIPYICVLNSALKREIIRFISSAHSCGKVHS